MELERILPEILERLQTCRSKYLLLPEEELESWPQEGVRALKRQGLLAAASPATSVACELCEEDCALPVQCHHYDDGPVFFIVCEMRDDTSLIPVDPERLKQWQTSLRRLARFIQQELGLNKNSKFLELKDGVYELGMGYGKTKCQMLGLRTDEIHLVAGGMEVDLAELIDFRDGAYVLDKERVTRMVDSSHSGDPRHIPSTVKREARKLDTEERHQDWNQEYRKMMKKNPKLTKVKCAELIAKKAIAKGATAGTIRRNLKA